MVSNRKGKADSAKSGRFAYGMVVVETCKYRTTVFSDRRLTHDALRRVAERRRIAGSLEFCGTEDVEIFCDNVRDGKEFGMSESKDGKKNTEKKKRIRKVEDLSINEAMNFGMLNDPRSHTAAFGVRLCDNRSRSFCHFMDRETIIGEKPAALALRKFVLSKRTLDKIKKGTHFQYGLDYDGDGDFDMECEIKDLSVKIHVRCSGEYCHIASYADRKVDEEGKCR